MSAVDLMEHQNKIGANEAKDIKELFLTHYKGEDEYGATLLRLRTPLRIAKQHKEHPQILISRILQELRPRIAISAALMIVLGFILIKPDLTGRIIQEIKLESEPVYSLFWIIIILFSSVLFFISKNKKWKKK